MFPGFIQYFQTLDQHPVQRMAFLVGGLLLFWIIEGSIPLMQFTYKKNRIRHAGLNIGFTAIHLIIHTILAVVIIKISDWCFQQQFGIVYWAKANVLWTIIITFLTLDFFAGWLVHVTEHKIPILWRFHIIHHADLNVDVTTGLRHHPVESVIRGLFFFMGIFISGCPMYAVMIFQTFLVFFTAFTHANISLPKWVDTSLSYLFISPNMHKVHHHWKQPFTDSNYGAVLSIWDRISGTFRKLEPSHIRYGLDNYNPEEKDEDFIQLLKRPFRSLKEIGKERKRAELGRVTTV